MSELHATRAKRARCIKIDLLFDHFRPILGRPYSNLIADHDIRISDNLNNLFYVWVLPWAMAM